MGTPNHEWVTGSAAPKRKYVFKDPTGVLQRHPYAHVLGRRHSHNGELHASRERIKEQLGGELRCNVCGIQAGDVWREDRLISCLLFDCDGLTPEHAKLQRKSDHRTSLSEVRSGVAQWLCKLCHATKSAHESMGRSCRKQEIACSLARNLRQGEPRRTLVSKGVFAGFELKENMQNVRQSWHFADPAAVFMKCPFAHVFGERNKAGDLRGPQTRAKEELGLELECAECGLRTATTYGKTATFGVALYHFDCDGLTTAHAPPEQRANLGVVAAELEQGVSQMLCKFCHGTKSSAERHLTATMSANRKAPQSHAGQGRPWLRAK